jgi:hypothetical protein
MWPQVTAGFFKVQQKIPDLLSGLDADRSS